MGKFIPWHQDPQYSEDPRNPEDHIRNLNFVRGMVERAMERISRSAATSATGRMKRRDQEELNVYYQVVTGERRYWSEPMPGLNELLLELQICRDYGDVGKSCEDFVNEFLIAVCRSEAWLNVYLKGYTAAPRSKKSGMTRAAIQGNLRGVQYVIDLLDEAGYPCPEDLWVGQ